MGLAQFTSYWPVIFTQLQYFLDLILVKISQNDDVATLSMNKLA